MFYIYMVRCTDGSVYTGIAADPARRMREHLERGRACAKYTRSHPVQALDALWRTDTKADACRLENYLKTLTRVQKLALIEDPALLGVFFAGKLDPADYLHIPGATLEEPVRST